MLPVRVSLIRDAIHRGSRHLKHHVTGSYSRFSFIYHLSASTVDRDSSVGKATGYGLDGPGLKSLWEARFSAPVQTRCGTHPDSCTMGTEFFPGVKSGRGVTLTSHPLIVPWSKKSRTIPLFPLWAVRPLQSFSACTRVHFTFSSCYNTITYHSTLTAQAALLFYKQH